MFVFSISPTRTLYFSDLITLLAAGFDCIDIRDACGLAETCLHHEI